MTQPPTQNGHCPFGWRRGIAAVLAAGLVLWPAFAHAGAPTKMLKDIVPGAAGSDPREFCAFNGQLFFQAADPSHGAEVWVSDTTEAGTVLFANIAPEAPVPQGSFPANFTAYNNKLYFSAFDGSTGRDVWVTTGAAGNLNRLNVNPGADANPKYLTVANGQLFFAADNGVAGVELLHTDGTSVAVTDLRAGPGSSFPSDFVALGSELYFTADDGNFGREIWMSDGTSVNLLADIRAGAASSSPSSLTIYNGNLYFAADDGVNGSQLWVSNGQAGNAQTILNLTEPGDFALPSEMTAAAGLLFLASRGDYAGAPTGMELWWTTGVVTTLGLVSDILPGPDGSNPAFLTAYNGSLLFSAAGGPSDNELWKFDGSASETALLKDINSGPAGSQPGPFFLYRGHLYFAAETAAEGRELWQTDGTTANTIRVKNINPDTTVAAGSDPDGFVEVRGRLVFAATTAANGREPWIIDYDTPPVITEGAAAPVTMLKDGTPTPFSLTLHATDAESDTLTWSITASAGHGTATASGTGAAKAIGYTPATHYLGTDTFTVGVNDGHGGTAACTVTVTVTTTVPNVVGMTQSAAGTALTSASLVTGTVTQQYSNTVTAGLVISQDPAAGAQAASGSAVALVVSKGPLPAITGSIIINGNRSATNSPVVTLALTWGGGAGTGVVRMRFSNDGSTWTAWKTLQASLSYTLPAGDGYKTVRVQYLDSENNHSPVFSDYIRLDATPPTGTIVINDGASTTTTQSVTLKLTWADGTGAGVTRMRFSDNGSTWTAWKLPTATYAYTLPAGPGYHTVRVQYLDGAGNYSAVYNDYIKLVAP